MQQYNANNPSVKRIMREIKEMRDDPSDQYTATPLEENLFEWHFTVRGPKDTEFEGGLYHGRLILPVDYPFKPPHIVLLNPSGRFEVGTKICLSLTAFHPEQWQPSWSIKTILLALISFMPNKGEGAIGALDYPASERRIMAKQSVNFHCDKCDCVLRDLLPEQPAPETSPSENQTTTTTTTTTSTIVNTDETPTTPTTTTTPSSSSLLTSTPSSIETQIQKSTAAVVQPPFPLQHQVQPTQNAVPPQPQIVQNYAQIPPPIPVQTQNTPVAHTQVNTRNTVNIQNSNGVKNMDYLIIAILVLMAALIIRKYILH
eukprot:TRINITY_DN3234_c0_g1_i2.p1 TRINITY_DN3234_c0_g1~~TRINITY_DN3234_c0_g1_i2.p1  ORF type:complete len:315 (+),score=68.89 TRINITY_DN3234_c0_g1_i2:240-1184(+)